MTALQTTDHLPMAVPTPPPPPAPYPAAQATGEVLQTQAPQVVPKSSRDAAASRSCHPAWQGIPWLGSMSPRR